MLKLFSISHQPFRVGGFFYFGTKYIILAVNQSFLFNIQKKAVPLHPKRI